jgi:hypothetical protein
MRTIAGFAAFAAVLAIPAAAARAAGGGDETEALRKRLDEVQRKNEEDLKALREEIERIRAGKAAPGKGLDEQVEDLDDRVKDLEKDLKAALRSKPDQKLLNLSLDGLFAAGSSTATDPQILDLQGGGHDPHKRGFTVENVELSADGAVDPYFTAEGHIVFAINPAGETETELEEMFLTTTSLPGGFQAKVGQFFTQFGRLNASHPHTWDFVDQPVVNTRMFGGDGMRGPGASLSWLAPTHFPLELTADVHNANGPQMTSFIGTPGDPQVGGRPSAGRDTRSLADMVYTPRATASFDLSPTTILLPGVSASYGPNGTGSDGRTRILGADMTLKWKPLANDAGFPNLTWQNEYMVRKFGASSYVDPSGPTFVPGAVLDDAGFYSQVNWGFRRDWTLGVRYDWAKGRGGGAGADPDRDLRTRESIALTWYPSHFSKIRLQVDRDRDHVIGRPVTTVWLQFEILIGAHGAHTF